MIDICEAEDLSKACCLNCFNGLPNYGCPKQEEESNKLRQMVHEKAERIHKGHYDKGYQQGKIDAIEEVLQKVKELKLDEHCPDGCHCSSEQDNCPYVECINDVIRMMEQLKEQN